MYWNPPQNANNPTNPFWHPLNEKTKISEEKQFKARIGFIGDKPSDNNRDMRTAKQSGMFVDAKDVAKAKGVMFDITFKSEGQFNRFMGSYNVQFVDKLDEATVDTSHYRSDHGKRPNPNETGGWSFSDKKFGKEFYMSPNKMPYKDAKAEAEKIAKKKGFSKIYLAASYQPEFADDNVQIDEEKKLDSRGLGVTRQSGLGSKKVNGEKARKVLTSAKVPHDMVMGTIRVPERFVRIAKEKLDDAFGGMFQKKTGFKVSGTMKEDVQLDEATPGDTRVVTKGDQNQYERISRALTAAKKAGKIAGYEGTVFNRSKGEVTLIFDSKAHKPASERRKVAKMIKDFGLEFDHSIEEGFASDAQRRAAFASGYKAKGKKKEEEVEEGLRQAMSGPRETESQKQKRMEKDNFDLYKKRQKRRAGMRGEKLGRKLTPKQEKDYKQRVNLDQIKAFEETIMEGAKFSPAQLKRLKTEYGKIGSVDPEKPTYGKLTDMLDKMTDEQLKQIEQADIKFMSSLAANRSKRRGMKEEESSPPQHSGHPASLPGSPRMSTPPETPLSTKRKRKQRMVGSVQEMSAKKHYEKMIQQDKLGGKRVTPIDRERFPNREKEGLEGPYRSKKSGQVYYYDKKAGKYYDPLSDMFMQVKDVMEEKGTYSSMGRRGVDKPLIGYIEDLEVELKKMGLKYSDKRVNPDDVMKAYNANMSPKEAAKMLKKKG
jgi:hypothetical protein